MGIYPTATCSSTSFRTSPRAGWRCSRALGRTGVAYFLVGDDWQSIYRFAGSDVSLVRNCGDHLGHVRERTLSQTFRFGEGILAPSTAFVQRNPEQTQRPLRSANSQLGDEGVIVVVDGDPARGLRRALQDIERAARGRASVLVLGRYGASRRLLPRNLSGTALRDRVQHRSQCQGPRGRLRCHTRPQGRPVWLPVKGWGRPTAGARAPTGVRTHVPVRGGAAALLCGDDTSPHWHLPRHGLKASIPVCWRAEAEPWNPAAP